MNKIAKVLLLCSLVGTSSIANTGRADLGYVHIQGDILTGSMSVSNNGVNDSAYIVSNVQRNYVSFYAGGPINTDTFMCYVTPDNSDFEVIKEIALNLTGGSWIFVRKSGSTCAYVIGTKNSRFLD